MGPRESVLFVMAWLGGIYPILLALSILGLLIILHELGHFFFCRRSGIRVEKFSVGFGKEIWAYQGKETRYVLSAIPFGGYVKPAGEDLSSLEHGEARNGDYLAASVPARMGVVAAGPVMNWFLGWILFVLILLIGRPIPLAAIGGFVEGYPAERSGLAAGDRVIAVEGEAVRYWMEMTAKIQEHGAENLTLTVERGGEQFDVVILPRVEEDKLAKSKKKSRIGIKPDMNQVEVERFSFFPALGHAAVVVWEYTIQTYKALFDLLIGRLSLKAVSGPIGVVGMAEQASSLGLIHVLQLAAMLSISLAVFNMLPIPALDGGHFLFLVIEAVKKKPVSLKFQERSTQVCFVFLITLFVVITVNDLSRLPFLGALKARFFHTQPLP